ncbi:MAG: hypothetical protein Q9219_002705 [cf. Caloplaca sp. 3 TL-2023]
MTADLIIGVDFGMTYTGVAFFVPDKTDPERAKLIQKWPGKEDKTENKVLTSLIYHGDKLQSWGFLCDSPDQPEHPDSERQQYFKLWLDRSHLQKVYPDPDSGVSHEDVKKWFTDFLKKLYQHIKRTFLDGPYDQEWRSTVNFVFSVPTTWKTRNVLSTFKECIQEAGFKNRKNHNYSIGLTEAEAAAIHTFRSKALSIRDAAVLEAVGKPVGSVNIDMAFASFVQGRLEKAEKSMPSIADDDPEWAEKTAWQMTRDRFQYHKCAFGTTEGTHEKFRMKIPDFSTSRSFPDACIESKYMTFTKKDMSNLFDTQLEGIYSILDNQLDALKKERPSKQVDYLVLSGGLGSSVYVKQKLADRYIDKKSRYPNAKHLQIYTADDPQTAVVQGLVLNEAQQHETGNAVLKSRTSPASYGVLCKEPYDQDKHVGIELERDEHDGKLYAVDLIHWFLKRGDSVSDENVISYDFKRKLSPDTNLRRDHWKSKVVISWKDRAYLPRTLGEGTSPLPLTIPTIPPISQLKQPYPKTSPDAQLLCTIKSNPSDLRLDDFEKVGYFYNLVGTKFLVAKYKVQVNIEVADILFEVWCNDVKLSEDQRIQVQWKEGAEVGRPLEQVDREGGRARDIWDG